MARTLMAAWWAAAALAGGTAAETFHDKDGIRFEGTIRLALSDAAVCNVLEANEIPEAYERMKANQGRPLHVWRVDLSVRNGSGRELDFLRADSWVLSEWPPCTNWDGPSASALEPFIRVEWADTLEVVSMSYGMRRGQQVRRALYVLAFDGHEPRFGEWDIRYTFSNGEGATESPAGAGRGRPGRRGGTSVGPAAAGDPSGSAPAQGGAGGEGGRRGDSPRGDGAGGFAAGHARAGSGAGGPLPPRAGVGGGGRGGAGRGRGGALPAVGRPGRGALHGGAGPDQPGRGNGAGSRSRACGGGPGPDRAPLPCRRRWQRNPGQGSRGISTGWRARGCRRGTS